MKDKRPSWGHVSRRCVFCGKVGPRVAVIGGYSHRRCIPINRIRAAGRRDKANSTSAKDAE